MNDQETETFLKEIGVSDDVLAQMKGEQPPVVPVNQDPLPPITDPAPVVVPDPKLPEPAVIVDPAFPEPEPKLWADDDILNDVQPAKNPDAVVEDWKSKYEEVNGKLTRIESNKFKKAFLELVDAPDFNFETFLEAQVSRKTDYTKVPLESLFKASLEADTIAGYTEDEITSLWEKKKAELENDTASQKALKSQLVNFFQSKEAAPTQEEPEIFKTWKQSREQVEQEIDQNRKNFIEFRSGIETFSKSLIGKKIAGVEITKEVIEDLPNRMGLDYYKDDKGKLNPQKVTIDQLKAIMFDKVVSYLKKEAVIEATKTLTRPNASPAGGPVVDTDQRTEQDMILDAAAQQLGLKSAEDLKF